MEKDPPTLVSVPDICGHSYTTQGKHTFACARPPHPSHPDQHYYIRDRSAQDPYERAAQRPRRKSNLIMVPGEKRR